MYKLTSFNWNGLGLTGGCVRWCFNCTNLHPSTETVNCGGKMKKFRVSIVQTYILQLKHAFIISRLRRKKFQLYKLTSFNWNSGAITYRSDLLSVSIVQTYILQLKREEKVIARLPLLGFNCTNLHPSTETNWRRISEGKDSKFQLYKLTSFNWNNRRSLLTKSDLSFNCTNLHPSTETNHSFQIRLYARSFNCTNLHPSTETHYHAIIFNCDFVSIVQTYILQLKRCWFWGC